MFKMNRLFLFSGFFLYILLFDIYNCALLIFINERFKDFLINIFSRLQNSCNVKFPRTDDILKNNSFLRNLINLHKKWNFESFFNKHKCWPKNKLKKLVECFFFVLMRFPSETWVCCCCSWLTWNLNLLRFS
jgi:hypothetical protein